MLEYIILYIWFKTYLYNNIIGIIEHYFKSHIIEKSVYKIYKNI